VGKVGGGRRQPLCLFEESHFGLFLLVLGNSQGVKVLTQNLPGIFALKIAPNLAELQVAPKLLAGRVLPSTKQMSYVCMQIRPYVLCLNYSLVLS
jgi:hypothetical protein